MFPVNIKAFRFVLVGLLFIGVTAAHKAEALPFDPLSVGLSPGEQFRLAFVTSGTRNANSANIIDYNNFVQAQANAGSLTGGLGLNWTTIGSTDTVDARDNTGTNPDVATGVRIFGLTGIQIADDNEDLWDNTLDAPITFDENGGVSVTEFIWTGTRKDGTADPFHLGDSSSVVGALDSSLIWTSVSFRPSTELHPFYAISEAITVPGANSSTPVSEPGPLALLGIGLIGIACLRRRERN